MARSGARATATMAEVVENSELSRLTGDDRRVPYLGVSSIERASDHVQAAGWHGPSMAAFVGNRRRHDHAAQTERRYPASGTSTGTALLQRPTATSCSSSSTSYSSSSSSSPNHPLARSERPLEIPGQTAPDESLAAGASADKL